MITVAMITMNEEQAMQTVVEDIRKAVPDAEILIVDSSRDRTPDIAESLGVKVIRQYPPQGYGPAMDRALRSASGEVVVTMDCDNTYPAHRIPEFARLVLEDNCDLVDGSRLKSKPEAMPWVNYLANTMFAYLAAILFFRRLTDLHSGMRAYRKELIESLSCDAQGAALPVELLLRPIRMGYRVKVVYIDYAERIGQSTMRPFESAWWTLKRILRARFLK
jgi:glycosyltransferase involved in cell wall biosynthesis